MTVYEAIARIIHELFAYAINLICQTKRIEIMLALGSRFVKIYILSNEGWGVGEGSRQRSSQPTEVFDVSLMDDLIFLV